MSSVSKNQMGPVKDVDPKIAEIVSTREIKHAAIHALHEKHRENKMHKFVEDNFQEHVQAWKPLKYAEEVVAYGVNYFVKVQIAPTLCVHIRVHRQKHHDVWDFYSLHETIKHNQATCIWTIDEPLVYFNA
ncbi:unnamed protein product (mitochondrion) [Plasmodiophora brassicae]|uniref:Cystatin domain-containing protein n=1 Tax=Plasmodiophora brassicae TaxID=37360 RepID=A0A0G4J4L9_PLABS|nr:hypothetical protein PBRA_002461 [Plasmodiophora brassicae]SPQ93618.1 unnamed protein product [Plasmodiophora brassicae]